MIWIQENKGLAAFLGLSLAGCAALAFMLFGSYRGYVSAFADFETSRKSVESLERKPLFPDEESIQLKKAAVDAYAKDVSALREKLVTFQNPLNLALTGNEFQGRLTEEVERIQELARREKVNLPENFRLDFDRWVNSPAPQGAVPKLDFQLVAISDLLTTAIESGISSVESVVRKELAEESGGGAADAANPPAGITAEPPLVERYPVELTFQTSHEGLENMINTLSNASRTPNHFFIVRLIEIRNQKVEGPLKEDTFAPQPIYAEIDSGQPGNPGVAPTDPGLVPPDGGAVAPPDPGAPALDPAVPVDPAFPVDPGPVFPPPTFGAGTPVAYRDARVLLGEEKLNVFLQVEVVRFRPEAKTGEEENPENPESAGS